MGKAVANHRPAFAPRSIAGDGDEFSMWETYMILSDLRQKLPRKSRAHRIVWEAEKGLLDIVTEIQNKKKGTTDA